MTATVDEMDGFSFHETILQQGELISDKLNMLRIEHFPPDAMKSLRTFSLLPGGSCLFSWCNTVEH
jgi:chromosome partitioning protein